MKQDKEMAALLNSAKEVELSDGRKIKIFAVPWVRAAIFTRAAEPVFKLFFGEEVKKEKMNALPVSPELVGIVEFSGENSSVQKPELSMEDVLSTLMKEHMGNLLELAECCTNLTIEQLGYLQMDDAVLVCGEVLGVNMTFFRQRLQGRLPALLEKLLDGLKGSGLTQPVDSSPQGTLLAA